MSKEDKGYDPAGDFLDRLFGDVGELAGEELDLLFETVAPGEDAAARVRAQAEKAAVEYRKQNKIPPEHVQSALAATRQETSLAGAKTSTLRKIVDHVLQPVRGPVYDPAVAYRSVKEDEVTDKDREILDALEGELEEDWSKEEDK